MEARQQRFSVGYLIATVILFVLLQSVLFAPHRETLTYSEFKALVNAGKVRNVVLDRQTISGAVVAEGLEGLLPKETIEELRRDGDGPHPVVTGRVDGLSAHADADGLLRWLGTAASAPERVLVVHGDPRGTAVLAARVQTDLGWPADAPAYRDQGALDRAGAA